MDSNLESIKLTELKLDLIIEDINCRVLENLGSRALNLSASLLLLWRRRNSQIAQRSSRCSRRREKEAPESLVLSEAPEAHGSNNPPRELGLPKLDDEVHKALILLWRTPPSTTTSPCSWSSHRDLPLYRQRPPPTINSLVSSKASTNSSCVDGVVNYLPPRVHIFCPGSCQVFIIIFF